MSNASERIELILLLPIVAILMISCSGQNSDSSATAVTASATPSSTIVSLPEVGLQFLLMQPFEISERHYGDQPSNVRSYWITDRRRFPNTLTPRNQEGDGFYLTVFPPGERVPLDLSRDQMDGTIQELRNRANARGWQVEFTRRVTVSGASGIEARILRPDHALRQEAYLSFDGGGGLVLLGEFEFSSVPRNEQEALFSAFIESVRHQP